MRFPRQFHTFTSYTDQKSFNGLYWFFGLLLGSLVLAAVLAPLIRGWVLIWQANSDSHLAQYLAHKPLAVYFNRVRLISVLIAFPLMLKYLGLFSNRMLGIDYTKPGLRRFIIWFALGILLLLLLISMQIRCGAYTFADKAILPLLLTTLISALAVALIEEILFRAVLFRVFMKALPVPLAMLLSALFFAYVHFKITIPADSSVLSMAWEQLIGIRSSFEFTPFMNLVLLGIILNLLLLINKSLMPCIGFHAGIVWAMLAFRKMAASNVSVSSWLGSSKIIDGIFVSFLLGVIVVLLATYYQRHTAAK